MFYAQHIVMPQACFNGFAMLKCAQLLFSDQKNMLEFWFNPHVSMLRKLMIFALIALLTGVLYRMEPLKLDAILMFLGTGIIFLICRYCKMHFASQNPTAWLYRLLTWIPIALLISLIFMHIQEGEILLASAQGIGFMALAICLFSPLSLLNKNNLSNEQK